MSYPPDIAISRLLYSRRQDLTMAAIGRIFVSNLGSRSLYRHHEVSARPRVPFGHHLDGYCK